MRNYFSLFLILAQLSLMAQNDKIQLQEPLEGYWTGALVRLGNSVQILTADIYKEEEDTLRFAGSIPDWAYYGPSVSGLRQRDDSLEFNTYYGPASVRLDTAFMEMTGTVGTYDPPLFIHLKKSLKPYQPEILSTELALQNEGANISGTLYYPDYAARSKLACAVMVHGRGCSSRKSLASRARLLARYGLATFVYDKRGSEASGFACYQSNHDLNVSDVKHIVNQLAKNPRVDANRIGLISYSAGGWIAPQVAATSETPVAFLITLVGPTTSVLQQQLDGMEAFVLEEGLDEASQKDALRYTRLLFARDDQNKVFDELQNLVDRGKKAGWTEWLETDDYVYSADSFDQLWVQRFSHDPAPDLKAYPGPFLAIFGEKDFIVPYRIQVEQLESLMQEAQKENYQVKVLSQARHDLEHGSQIRELGGNARYFKYDRVAYGAVQYIIDFLREEGVL